MRVIRVDSRKTLLYITALATATALWGARPLYAQNEYLMHLGAKLPRAARKIGPDRFRSPWNWRETMKWVDKTYGRGSHPRVQIINQPGIKAIHLRNPSRKEWVGMNIYQLASGQVRFFVLPPQEGP